MSTTTTNFSCVAEALAYIFNKDDAFDDYFTDEETTAINLILFDDDIDEACEKMEDYHEALEEAYANNTPAPEHPYPYPYIPPAPAGGAEEAQPAPLPPAEGLPNFVATPRTPTPFSTIH